MQTDIISTYFSEHHKQRRVADLEQRLLAAGVPAQEASVQALAGFQALLKKETKKKGIKALIGLIIALVLLTRVVMAVNQQGTFLQISVSLAVIAYTLVSSLIWGLQLFALKEEITGFRDLRKL
ncbi:hypothetical protein [Chitinophaga nivalis]|uniref:Uncharacterized protein n=1 Tax=Chitinophaga nivalis TaxID=2991709 RepID=A0ABT3IL84_9BACT|nr:hypothetical protein [Chitinophaga nivalis]MCW3465577.1 hypothetical protein [Chitinophaga nivalis]MCW3484732.1 hypothetical protein [Chitinophaga nivalis]